MSTTRPTTAGRLDSGGVVGSGKHPDSICWKKCWVGWRGACDICTPICVADDVLRGRVRDVRSSVGGGTKKAGQSWGRKECL